MIIIEDQFAFCEWRIHEYWNGCDGGIESHFIQSYNCSSNRLEVTEKHWTNSYSSAIFASHVCHEKPREFGSLLVHPQDGLRCSSNTSYWKGIVFSIQCWTILIFSGNFRLNIILVYIYIYIYNLRWKRIKFLFESIGRHFSITKWTMPWWNWSNLGKYWNK